MALPSVPLPKSSVEIGGQTVEFRSLSRREAFKLGTDFKEDPNAGEIYVISVAVGVSEEEAAKWREETDPAEVGKLVEAVIGITGLVTDPKVPAHKNGTKEPSLTAN